MKNVIKETYTLRSCPAGALGRRVRIVLATTVGVVIWDILRILARGRTWAPRLNIFYNLD
jgi:hypothetical protein